MTLKFYYNGIKDDGGKLQRCFYAMGPFLTLPEGTITIHKRDRINDFSQGVHAAFVIENNTDIQTDYFENDRIRVLPDHPLYAQVKAAADQHSKRYAR